MIVALYTTNEREQTPPVWLRPEGMQAWFCVPDQRGPTDETDSTARPERSTSHCSKAEQCESHVSSPIPKGVRGLRLVTATYRLCEVRAIAVRNWSKWAACGESVSTENRLQSRRQWCITGHRHLLLSLRIRRIPNLSPQCLGYGEEWKRRRSLVAVFRCRRVRQHVRRKRRRVIMRGPPRDPA